MNQLFSFPRFAKYAMAQMRLRRKVLLLIIASSFLTLLITTLLFLVANKRCNEDDWMALFFTTGGISALLLIGHSFPFFRNKETCMNTLMLPASSFEKFSYEFVVKIVLFTLLYPLLFQLVAGIVPPIVEFIHPERTVLHFSFEPIIHIRKEFALPLICMGYLFAVSLAFAGASSIKRYPLIKTIVFVGITILLIVGYFYLLVEKLNLITGIGYVAGQAFGDDKSAFMWAFSFLGLSSLAAWIYAFFNLKEREV